jgi:hypothetical protein
MRLPADVKDENDGLDATVRWPSKRAWSDQNEPVVVEIALTPLLKFALTFYRVVGCLLCRVHVHFWTKSHSCVCRSATVLEFAYHQDITIRTPISPPAIYSYIYIQFTNYENNFRTVWDDDDWYWGWNSSIFAWNRPLDAQFINLNLGYSPPFAE